MIKLIQREIKELRHEIIGHDNTETFASNCTTPLLGLLGVIKSSCEHSWINTGMTLQGISLKQCMKCCKVELIVSNVKSMGSFCPN